jgi:FkbM family methyltransferase
MAILIERTLPDGRSIAAIAFAPLDEAGGQFEFVDVGARNGSFLLPPSYAKRARITGFEPNRVEYEKLVSGKTDAALVGLKEPVFAARRYFPHAVWSERAERTIYLTVGPGAVSLMGPADEVMTDNMWLEGDGGVSYLERHQAVVNTDSVSCVTLDEVLADISGPVDVLKLDVEGAELHALKGTRNLLAQRRVLLIFSEFLFVPYYRDRVTLGHQQVYLDELGYRLIGVNTDHEGYNWRRSAIRAENDRRMTYGGDAIYVVDPDRNPLSADQKYRLGLACMAFGFNAFGLNLMRDSGKLTQADFTAIEAEANRVPLARRLHRAWNNAPYAVYRVLQACGLWGRG